MKENFMSGSGALLGYLPLILVFVIFYFLVLRPQARQAQEHRTMLGDLNKGDTVVTLGGIRGEIIKLNEDTLVLASSDTELLLEKSAISRRVSVAPAPKSRVSKKTPKKNSKK